VLDALATLATATLHQTTCLSAAAPTNTIAMAMSAVGKQNVTLSPLTIPPNIPSQLLGNIPSITPPMWGSVPPPQSPLTALSTISALSQPAQPSPLNIPMHQLPFAVPIGFNNQSVSASGNQLIITQVPVAGHQNVTAPSAQSTVTVSSITGSGEKKEMTFCFFQLSCTWLYTKLISNPIADVTECTNQVVLFM
jgi:hypothetical protein